MPIFSICLVMKKILITLFWCGISIILNAQIIHVPEDQPTIQSGIDAASDGDTVLVAQNTYYENINFKGKAITVASYYLIDPDSAHINNTIIDGSQPANPDSAAVVMFFSGEDTTSVLSGFTITNGKGVLFSSLYARCGGGIAGMLSGAKIMHNKIINNAVEYNSDAGGGGICFMGGTQFLWTIIKDNIIKQNSVHDPVNAWGGGIYVSLNSMISNNIVENNSCVSESGVAEGGGIEFQDIFSNGFQIKLTDNHIRYNSLVGNTALGGGIAFLAGVASFQDTKIFYPSPEAFYSPASNYRFSKVYSHYYPSGVSSLRGNQISFNTIDAVEYWWGAGIYLSKPVTEFQILSNEISYNAGSDNEYSFGGAFLVTYAYDYKILIDANIVRENQSNIGGGLYINFSYNIEISNNLFLYNAGEIGGAIRFFHYLGDESNKEAILYEYEIGTSDKISVRRSELHPVLTNNTFFGNSASNKGGAILVEYAPNFPVIFNSIFWENSAQTGEDIRLDDTLSQTPISYNDINTDHISGSWYGEGSIYGDPVFIDPLAGNFSIDSCYSICAGSGTDSLYLDNLGWYIAPDHDIAGNPRPTPDGSQPDMGAYEVDYCVGVEELQVSGYRLQVLPNPTSGISDIRYQVSDIGYITVSIFDNHGQKILTLVDKEQDTGDYTIQFDTSGLPSGIYFIRLLTGDAVVTQKLVVMR
jgi:hypothetical protein